MSIDIPTCNYRFQAVENIFSDLEPGVYASTQPNLGLIDQEYSLVGFRRSNDKERNEEKSWARLHAHLNALNEDSAGTTSYKVLYIIRHGFGYHNEYMAKVGHDAWNEHWSHLDGDGKITWKDADLNPTGVAQAQSLSEFLSIAMEDEALPLPQSIYTSPLSRTLETTRLVFEPLVAKEGQTLHPHVKELLRERLTDHTCDERRSKSWIHAKYPTYVLEPDFPEYDVLWTGKKPWETAEEHEARKQRLLEDIWTHDSGTCVALVTHSYAISAILGVVGLPAFRVKEGSCVAIVVKGERIRT